MSNKQAVRKLLGLLREHKRIIGVIINQIGFNNIGNIWG